MRPKWAGQFRASLAAMTGSGRICFCQSKFTFAPGQDHRLPYDPGADYATQVQQSFNSSLEHLQTDYLDSYMLHGPSQGEGLGAVDFEVWQAMEALYRSGKVKLLGISNITLEQLEYLNHHVAIKPAFVQNRCYAVTGWDQETRALCKRHGIYYQGFSLLTANSQLFETPGYKAIEQRTGLSGPQIVFQTALKLGMIVLTGTSSPQHMQQDLDCGSVELTDDEVTVIETALMI